MDERVQGVVPFEDGLSPYRSFTREEWARLRADTPMTLTAEEVVRLQSLNDPISLSEVAEIYLQTPGPGAGSRLVPPADA